MPDPLWQRAWHRLSLRHVVHHTNPFIHIFKSGMILLVVYGLDVLTHNPDSISSMFTSLLAVSYSVLLAWYIGTSIIFAAGLGTFWGAVMTALFDGFDGVGLASGEELNRYYIELAIRLCLAVVLTIYCLWLLGKGDPGSMATAFFSAIFVQMARFSWDVLPADVNENLNVLSTVIVRILATSVPLAAALIINGVFSSAFVSPLFRDRMRHLEGKIQRNIDKMDRNPFGHHAQHLFELVNSYLGDVGLARAELQYRPWKTDEQQSVLNVHEQKAKHIMTILSAQVFCVLAGTAPVLNADEKAELHDIFQGSKKKTAGFESIERIDKTFSPRLGLLQLIMLQAMRNLEHFEAHNPIDEVVKRHHRGAGSQEEHDRLVEAV